VPFDGPGTPKYDNQSCDKGKDEQYTRILPSASKLVFGRLGVM
jgi:hypothetical protein